MTLIKTTSGPNFIPTVLSDFFDKDNFFSKRLFNQNFWQPFPPVNIKENENNFSIDFAAPGFNKADFKINVDDKTMLISAEISEEKNDEEKNYTRKEFAYNSFSRSFNLPQTIDVDKIQATYKDGILSLLAPKKDGTKVSSKKEIKVS